MTDDHRNADDLEAGPGDAERAVTELLRGTGLPQDDDQWQAAVLDAIDKPSRKRQWLTVVMPLAAAAALVLWAPGPREGRSPDGESNEIFESGIGVRVLWAAVVRSGDPFPPGAKIELRAALGDSAFTELRVYHDDRKVLLHCPGDFGCKVGAKGLTAVLQLPMRGTVQPLLMRSAEPLPAPTGDLNEDVTAAAGAEIVLGEAIEIR